MPATSGSLLKRRGRMASSRRRSAATSVQSVTCLVSAARRSIGCSAGPDRYQGARVKRHIPYRRGFRPADSLSGKARKARDYGIPVVTEDGFARLFAEYQRSVAAQSGKSSSGVRR